MELYIKLFEVLFPVFFIVSIGYFLGKKNPNFDTSFITTYSANFFILFSNCRVNFFNFDEKRLFKGIANIFFT